MFPSLSSNSSARLMTLALPLWATAECQPLDITPTSGNPISVNHPNAAAVSAIKRQLSRSGQPPVTSSSPKRPLESRKDCSIQPRCQYHEAALWASFRLVATRYQGSSGSLRRESLARLSWVSSSTEPR